MLDRNQLKNNGARFARSLQLLFKTASVFAGTHAALTVPLQNSFDQLNTLVKTFRQFTIGFVDNRVLLNNILTTDKTLQGLETEFLKRGIGAMTFDAGITMAAYKRAILVVSVQAKEIETDSESFLMAKAMNEIRNPTIDRIDQFMKESGMEGEGLRGGGGFGPGGEGA